MIHPGDSQKKSRPKALVDFDGLWTDVTGQAEAIGKAQLHHLARLSGMATDEMKALLEETRDQVKKAPHLHGWISHDRICAFADEDPFILHNGTISGIKKFAREGHIKCLEMLAGLERNGITDLEKLAGNILVEASAEYFEEKGSHSFRDETFDVLTAVLRHTDVVICTNSDEKSVRNSLLRLGLEVSSDDHPHPLRLRGFAQKNALTGDPRKEIDIHGRRVSLDRGHYRKILCEEAPDWVVGDVLSLDLALPMVLAREDRRFKKTKCILMKNDYTPDWALETVRSNKWPNVSCIERLQELVGLLTNNEVKDAPDSPRTIGHASATVAPVDPGANRKFLK